MVNSDAKLMAGLMLLIAILALATLSWNQDQERKLELAKFKLGNSNLDNPSIEPKKAKKIGFVQGEGKA